MARKNSHPAHQSQNRILQQTEVYLMSPILYVIINKWGISDQTKTRRSQIDKAITGPVKTITSAQVPFGWQAEGFVHAVYFWCNVRRWFPFAFRVDCGTELFFNANPIFGFAFLWCCHKTGYHPENWMIGCSFISPFIWLDGFLWVQVFRGLGWALAAGLAYGCWWFYTNS